MVVIHDLTLFLIVRGDKITLQNVFFESLV